MKKGFLIIAVALLIGANSVLGQDIHSGQVPAVITNNFQQAFPTASDVEWERSGENYQVEFETNSSMLSSDRDHDALYNKAGKLIRHIEEISEDSLPKKVLSSVNSEFNGYRIDDVKKITEGNKVTYNLELKKWSKEWKVAMNKNGKILGKVIDD